MRVNKILSKFSPIIILAMISTAFSFSQNNKIEKVFTSKSEKKINYAYSLPQNFDSAKDYNVLIAPGGGTSDDSDDFILWRNCKNNFDWILLETNATFGNSINTLKEFLDYLNENLHVIENKFHIMGFSANSADTFNVALNLPNYFHSVTGVPGHPRTNNKSDLIKLRNMEVNFIVGENDTYWLNAAEKYNTMLKELSIEVKLNIVKNSNHKLTSIVGDRFIDYMSWLKD